jgi:hypothetical protein
MKRRGVALALLVGWLLGVGTGLLGVAVTGGWYEYRLAAGLGRGEYLASLARSCEPVSVNAVMFLRCPRFRLPF